MLYYGKRFAKAYNSVTHEKYIDLLHKSFCHFDEGEIYRQIQIDASFFGMTNPV